MVVRTPQLPQWGIPLATLALGPSGQGVDPRFFRSLQVLATVNSSHSEGASLSNLPLVYRSQSALLQCLSRPVEDPWNTLTFLGEREAAPVCAALSFPCRLTPHHPPLQNPIWLSRNSFYCRPPCSPQLWPARADTVLFLSFHFTPNFCAYSTVSPLCCRQTKVANILSFYSRLCTSHHFCFNFLYRVSILIRRVSETSHGTVFFGG